MAVLVGVYDLERQPLNEDDVQYVREADNAGYTSAISATATKVSLNEFILRLLLAITKG